jgi:hypothetical protein
LKCNTGFHGWEGKDGVIKHIAEHFGLEVKERQIFRRVLRSITEYSNVNTSGKAGAQIPHLPLGDDSSPWGR